MARNVRQSPSVAEPSGSVFAGLRSACAGPGGLPAVARQAQRTHYAGRQTPLCSDQIVMIVMSAMRAFHSVHTVGVL